MNSFDNLPGPIWKSQAALVALNLTVNIFKRTTCPTRAHLSVSRFPNSTAIISSWKGSLSTSLMNSKVPIRSFVAENTSTVFKVLMMSAESEKLIFAPAQNFLPQDLSGERDFSLWHSLSLELVMCVQAKRALYGHVALNLGSLYLGRLTDWGRRVCWPLISRVCTQGLPGTAFRSGWV